MTLQTAFILSLVLIALCLVWTLILLITKGKRKKEHRTLSKKIIYFICILYACSVLLFATSVVFRSVAIKHGAWGDFEKKETFYSVIVNSKNGFVESADIPEDLRGSIIIYFKYGCPDCNGIHDELLQAIKDHPESRIYYVSTRSETGKKILARYHIDAVPSAVYIPYDSDVYHIQILYNIQKTPEEPVIFISDNFEKLIRMQTEDTAAHQGG